MEQEQTIDLDRQRRSALDTLTHASDRLQCVLDLFAAVHPPSFSWSDSGVAGFWQILYDIHEMIEESEDTLRKLH